MGFAECSRFLKVCLFLFPAAFLFQSVGLGTTNWVTGKLNNAKYGNAGLWKVCPGTCFYFKNSPGWVDATRAFGIIGVLAMVGSVGLLVAYVFVSVITEEKRKIIHNINVVVAFVGGGVTLLSIIIFAAKYKDIVDMLPTRHGITIDLGWSFAMPIIAGILSTIGGALLVADIKSISQPQN